MDGGAWQATQSMGGHKESDVIETLQLPYHLTSTSYNCYKEGVRVQRGERR